MVTNDLLIYIRESQKFGLTEADIKKALKETGWQDSDVDDAFKSLSPIPSQTNIQQVQKPSFQFNLPTQKLIAIKQRPYFKYILAGVLVLAIGFTLYKVFRQEKI